MTDEQIYKYLLGDVEVGEMYVSPLPLKYRKQDTNASFGLFTKEDNVIRWKDWGLSEPYGNKAINLYQYLMGFSPDDAGFRKALSSAKSEMERKFRGQQVVLKKSEYKDKSNMCPYLEYDSNFTDFELEYWGRYGIEKEDLLEENVFSLKSLRWAFSTNKTTSTPTDPGFVYIFRNNPISWKVYRPLVSDTKYKFRQWSVEDVIEGMHNFKPCNTCLGLSSTKERLVVKKALKSEKGYGFLNPTSENSFINLVKRKKEIVADRTILMYDADDAGYKASVSGATHLNCEYRDFRNRLSGNKDFSDYVDIKKGNHSLTELKDLILSTI